MEMTEKAAVTGLVHSFQSLGTLDGPGVRFVVFLQGCHLRCGCCHNPDTWDRKSGTRYTAAELAEKALRYRAYFGREGGITLSGGEPLLQPEFAAAIFRECKDRGINTCLDTSGSLWNEAVEEVLEHTDRVLLDIKYPTEQQYRDYVGCGLAAPLKFLEYLDAKKIPVTLRQVIIPGLNDTEENVDFLNELVRKHACIDKVELLPFKKICQTKYDQLGMKFRFGDLPEPAAEAVAALQKRITLPDGAHPGGRR